MKSNKKGFFTNGFLSSFFQLFSINSVLYILASKSITFPHLVSGYYHIIRQQVEKLVLKLNSCSGWLMEWNASAAAAKAKCGNIKTCRDAELHLNCSFKQLLLVTELHFNLTTLALRHWGVEKPLISSSFVFSLVSKREFSASKVETVSSRDKDGVIGIWKRWQIYFQWIQKCLIDKQFSLIMERSCCFLSGNSVQQSDDDDDDDDYGDDDINVSNHAAVPFFLSSNLE